MPDREKVIKAIDICLGHGKCDDCGYRLKGGYSTMDCRRPMMRDALALLKEQPEIVRCKDCKKWHTNCLPSCGRHGCDVFGDYTKPDDFCSFAERREGR